MPFSELTVLIAEDDPSIASLWERACVEMRFKTVVVNSVERGLEHLDADILICDMMLTDGIANVLIHRWIEDNGGPFVVVSGVLSNEQLRDAILNGADNAFMKTDFSNEVLRTLVMRYGRWVMAIRTVDKLRIQVQSQAKQIRYQWIAIIGLAALLLGDKFWGIISPLLPFI